MKYFKKGFTLVELLVVIGILAILTAVVLVAVNPGRQLQQSRDTKRRADVNTILGAISAYMADPVNNGQLPPTITAAAVTTGMTDCTVGNMSIGSTEDVNLAADVAPLYVADLPEDPSSGSGDGTNIGYELCIFDPVNRRISVIANGELAGVITVTR
jgi:type IV pilus assembly protein PilA